MSSHQLSNISTSLKGKIHKDVKWFHEYYWSFSLDWIVTLSRLLILYCHLVRSSTQSFFKSKTHSSGYSFFLNAKSQRLGNGGMRASWRCPGNNNSATTASVPCSFQRFCLWESKFLQILIQRDTAKGFFIECIAGAFIFAYIVMYNCTYTCTCLCTLFAYIIKHNCTYTYTYTYTCILFAYIIIHNMM